jgi:hypothetical protein
MNFFYMRKILFSFLSVQRPSQYKSHPPNLSFSNALQDADQGQTSIAVGLCGLQHLNKLFVNFYVPTRTEDSMKRSVLHATVLSTSLVLGMSFLEARALASDLEPQPFDARLEVEPAIWRPDVSWEASHPLDPNRASVLQRSPWAAFPNKGKSHYFH